MTVTKKHCTAWWTTPDGRCSDDDSGSGRHHCAHVDTYSEHEQQVHPKCECRCGATHKKPVAQLMIDRHEAKQRQASITISPTGQGRVTVGASDITSHVGGGTVEFKAGHATVIKVDMLLASAFARGEIELDEETARALEALGWSGPDTELLRRRDLQEALNIGGSVLREWDQLVEHAKAVADGYTQVVLNEDETLHKVAAALGGYAPDEIKWSRVIEAVVELAVRVEGLDK